MRHLDDHVRLIDLCQQHLVQKARLALVRLLRHQHALQGEGTML